MLLNARIRVLAVCLAALCVSSGTQAGRTQDSYLIIYRSPNFGTQMWLRIWIDGTEATTMATGHDFRTPISPGRHVLSAVRLPNDWQSRPAERVIYFRAGSTRELTAVWRNDRVELEDHPN